MKILFKASLLLLLCVFLQRPNLSECDDVRARVSFLDGSSTLFVGISGLVTWNENKVMPYAKFLGVRYGEPPVGHMRFNKVNEHRYRQDTVETKSHGHACHQDRRGNNLISKNDSIHEDCLFLNIFVPLNNDTMESQIQDLSQVKEKKAVYIFIHGGSFLRGSSSMYDSPLFSSQGDIVVVTINYRLGLLGFLTTDDGVIPANLGLWDQHLAISWVQQHIGAFGGDNTRITVGGQSAGSFSSILQSFYKGNDKLFKNTIAESGTPLSMKIVSPNGRSTATAYAKMAGCNLEDEASSMEIRECLMRKPASELALLKAGSLKGNALSIGPTNDDDFITKDTFSLFPQSFQHFNVPTRKVISPTFAKRHLLIGFNSEDGHITYGRLVSAMAAFREDINISAPVSSELFPNVLNQKSTGIRKDTLVDAVLEKYTDWTQPSNLVAQGRREIDILTDLVFAVPSLNTALIHAEAQRCSNSSNASCLKTQGNTFVYEFTLPETSLLATCKTLPWFRGTKHGRELLFLSDRPERLLVPGLSDLMIRSWSNFVKYGNPNTVGSTEWPEYTEDSQALYQLSENPKLIDHAFASKIHFWNKYLPGLEDALLETRKEGEETVACRGERISLDTVSFVISLVTVFKAVGK